MNQQRKPCFSEALTIGLSPREEKSNEQTERGKPSKQRLNKYNFMISYIRFLILWMSSRKACKANDKVSGTFTGAYSVFNQATLQQLIFLSTSSSILGMSRGEVSMVKASLARFPAWVPAFPEPFSHTVGMEGTQKIILPIALPSESNVLEPFQTSRVHLFLWVFLV